ncbi:toxin [bacterium]|nr:MAG: toxin [bacterium]
MKKEDPEGAKRIKAVMERLLENPEDTDGMLAGPHRGKMKKYVGRSGYRLIYKWCDACRKLEGEVLRDCPDCGRMGDESVVFFDLFHKADAKRLGY